MFNTFMLPKTRRICVASTIISFCLVMVAHNYWWPFLNIGNDSDIGFGNKTYKVVRNIVIILLHVLVLDLAIIVPLELLGRWNWFGAVFFKTISEYCNEMLSAFCVCLFYTLLLFSTIGVFFIRWYWVLYLYKRYDKKK